MKYICIFTIHPLTCALAAPECVKTDAPTSHHRALQVRWGTGFSVLQWFLRGLIGVTICLITLSSNIEMSIGLDWLPLLSVSELVLYSSHPCSIWKVFIISGQYPSFFHQLFTHQQAIHWMLDLTTTCSMLHKLVKNSLWHDFNLLRHRLAYRIYADIRQQSTGR